MKRLHLKSLLAILILLFIASYAYSSQVITGKVIGIADGDTITVLQDKTQYKIRLYGIDTPERNQDFGTRAKQFTSDQVFGKQVRIVLDGEKTYGRVVGVVYIGDACLNEEIVRNGFAWVSLTYCKEAFCQDWLELEEIARAAKIGLWNHKDPIPPWEFRWGKKSSSDNPDPPAGIYHGNTSSMVFHQSTCKHFNCKNCTVGFKSRDEAIKAGYKPCGMCKP